jgi:hypothetical protein
MPGVAHETIVLLLRENPTWLGLLVEALAGRALPGRLRPDDAAVRAVDPVEVRPDLVFTEEDGGAWVMVEVQRGEDPEKARKWPLAVAALWNERRVAGDLVVIAVERAVVRWARGVGTMVGSLGTSLTVSPVVVPLTGDSAERLLDPAHPELAFFAAWTMHERHGAKARATVLRAAEIAALVPDEALRGSLLRGILGVLHPKVIESLREVLMDPQKTPTNPALDRLGEEFQRKYGAQLEARGEARGEAKMLLTILAARGLPIDDAVRARVLGCGDTATLERWGERAIVATTLAEVFKA